MNLNKFKTFADKSIVTPFLDKIAKEGLGQSASFLMWTAAIGWGLSSTAQTLAVAFNKNISNKEKRFLIPQEIMDGVVNVALFCIFTRGLQEVGKQLVKKGRLLPKSFIDKFKSSYKQHGNVDFSAKGRKERLNNLKTKLEEEATRLLETNYNDLKTPKDINLHNELTQHINGVSMIASITGSIIGSNFFTPIVRNKLASIYQKSRLYDDTSCGGSKNMAISKPYATFKSSVKPKSMNQFLNATRYSYGSMKI